jgi:tetratricopeptide (TPR) repeat protein
MTDNGMLGEAIGLHRQGRLDEAVSRYQEVLAREPRNVDALHLLGLLMVARGDPQRAVTLIGSAVQLLPSSAPLHANLGGALQAVGRYEEALYCYERAVALQPQLALAHRGRGSLLLLLGRIEAAAASLERASQLAPADDQALNTWGAALERLNRLEQALQCFNQALALNPNNVDAHHNKALIEVALNRHAEALPSFERALSLRPRSAALHTNHGVALLALGRAAEALASFEQAIAIRGDELTPHHNRGLALMHLKRYAEAGESFERALRIAPASRQSVLWRGKAHLKLNRPAEALTCFERALTLEPGEFDAQFQRGMALALLERHEESVAAFGQAVALNERSAEGFNNRGAVLMRLFRPEEALVDFEHALALDESYADAHLNAGHARRGLGRHLEALTSYDRAQALRPEDAAVTWSKAVLTLGLGDFRAGWPLYEARLQLEPARQLHERPLGRPRWSGDSPLEGKTLFVYAEQGLGDTLQFCRYLPVLNRMGARVVFEVQPALKGILASLPFEGELIARGEPMPPFDCYIPLLSLPLALHTQIDSIPGGVPYLSVDAAARAHWADRLVALTGLKIGINWRGNPEAEKRSALQARSFPLAAAAPLATLPGMSLVSLQKGAGAEELGQVEFGARIAQLTDPGYMGADEIAAETAPLLLGLDLVITGDTALAHLAGALGAQVWVVLQSVPDWRWLTDRADSPWYPTMRLLRQRTAGNWPELFERIAAELEAGRVAGAPRST